jgi:hypothetical protein
MALTTWRNPSVTIGRRVMFDNAGTQYARHGDPLADALEHAEVIARDPFLQAYVRETSRLVTGDPWRTGRTDAQIAAAIRATDRRGPWHDDTDDPIGS